MRFARFFLLALGLALAGIAGCNLGSAQGSPSAGDGTLETRKNGGSPQALPEPDGRVDGAVPSTADSRPGTTVPTPTDVSEASDDSTAETRVPVEVFRVEPRRIEERIQATGELRANEQISLRAETSGRIVALHFDEGQRVSEGDLLVKVDDADLQAELRRVRVQKELAERREARSRALLDENTISQELYDEANSQLRVLGAQEEQLEARIRKTEVRAPFSGVVGLREISEGSYVTPAQVIASLQDLDPIKVDFAVPEKYAGQIDAGDRIAFTVSGSESPVDGKVYAVEPRIDVETRTVQVRARARNAGENLLPGAFARVELVTGQSDDALLVPAIALVPGNASTTVFVVDADERAQPRTVRVGQRTERKVHIVEGLEPGDRVITTGVQQVRRGTLVDIRRESSHDEAGGNGQ